MKIIEHQNQVYLLRLVRESDISDLRVLINLAYKDLADRGLNYTATYQDEDITRQRISKGKAFVLEFQNQLIATILYWKENHFTQKNTAYLGQLAVHPRFKRMGIGSLLMDYCEELAKKDGFDGLQLDTAQPAQHLVDWYLKRDFKILGTVQWEGKTYQSFVFEKIF